MTQFGMTLSSEEHGPAELVDLAVAAEQAGFDFVSISDHYHPWVSAQGHSPFVWSVLGAIAQATEKIHVGVGVSCPTTRIHPAVIAQAVSTTACLLPERFTWGVGTGEALNEHITAQRWPPAPIRLEMLKEAVSVIRKLLDGGSVTHYGEHYSVEDARLFDIPEALPPILMSAFGPEAAKAAADAADGLWVVGPGSELVNEWKESGGQGPVWSQLSLSWDPDKDTAVKRALRQWPNTLVPGQLGVDLRTVEHFEQATEPFTEEQIAEALPCGPDLEPTIGAVHEAIDADIDHIYFHQIGDPRNGFIDAWVNELRPAIQQ